MAQYEGQEAFAVKVKLEKIWKGMGEKKEGKKRKEEEEMKRVKK